MKRQPPPVRPGELLRYVERVCANCGTPFRALWAPGKRPRRVCEKCRGTR